MEIGMFFLLAAAVIMIIGLRTVIKHRDGTIVELLDEIYNLKCQNDKRQKLPTNEDGVYSESIESGDIHGSD